MDDLTPEAIGEGIVFLLARWSPDAVMRRDELLERLQDRNWRGTLVIVEDADPGFDRATFSERFGLALHGWGEAFLVVAGAVVARSSAEEGCTLAELVEAAADHGSGISRLSPNDT